MYDICIIGPVTRDVIRIVGKPDKVMPGGVVYYASHAYRRLGLSTAVISKAAPEDAGVLLQELRESGVSLYCRRSAHTLAFENIYRNESLDAREQRVAALADPFTPADLGTVKARAFHLGPLTGADMDGAFIEEVARRGRVYLDVQGLLRRITDGRVEPSAWLDSDSALAHVHGLKADLVEAQLLSGETDPERAAYRISACGPQEVLITLGSRGSLILAGDELHRIPGYSPPQVLDATGCGDTYFAAYVFQRLRSDDIVLAGRFATAVAALKLAHDGPFSGRESDARALISCQSGAPGG